MSTTVSIIDEDEFRAALADVRFDTSDNNWLLCGHTDNPDEVELVGSGNGGVEQLVDYLDDSRYMYGLVRLTVTIDMSETTKFVYLTWIGKDLPFTRRGKYGVKSGAIQSIFEPYQLSLEYDGDDKSAVTQEEIQARLEDTSGTKSKVLEASEAKDRPERGFTSHTSSSSRSSGPMSPTGAGNIGSKIGRQGSSFSGMTSTAKGGSTVAIDDSVREVIAAVRSDADDSVTWMCAKFQDNNVKKPLYCPEDCYGQEISKIGEVLKEDEVACVLLRASDVVDDIATVKFAYILWVGERVKPLTKGKIPTYKGELEDLFQPFHVHIHATQPSEVRAQVIQDKIGSASGSKSNIK